MRDLPDHLPTDAPNSVSPHRVPVMATAIPGLDDVLGGGLPALSFNLIAGGPGSGKTTLAMQLMFNNATTERPGLFITLLGETSLKMLRYQQQFTFFDVARVGTDVHFLNLSEEALEGELDAVMARIVEEVDRIRPGIVVIDSFRSLVHTFESRSSDLKLEHFVQRLALHLTTWEITSFLIGEYQESELRNPVFTVADGIVWLSQEAHRSSVVRRLQVVKARGVAPMPGLHTLRISTAGIQVFPRVSTSSHRLTPKSFKRLSSGIPALDEMMQGGIPVGDSLVLAGPTGSGKTSFSLQFINAGLTAGESSVVAIFEEQRDSYLERAAASGVDLAGAESAGKLRILYLRPLDLSVDETLEEIRAAVHELSATRVVIDSISGFEMALAQSFREDFRESLYRLIGALTALGVTIFSTVEVVGDAELQFTGYRISFLTDDIISQRYVELDGSLQRALVIVKMRGSGHSREFRLYETGDGGVQIGRSLREFRGITRGMPVQKVDETA